MGLVKLCAQRQITGPSWCIFGGPEHSIVSRNIICAHSLPICMPHGLLKYFLLGCTITYKNFSAEIEKWIKIYSSIFWKLEKPKISYLWEQVWSVPSHKRHRRYRGERNLLKFLQLQAWLRSLAFSFHLPLPIHIQLFFSRRCVALTWFCAHLEPCTEKKSRYVRTRSSTHLVSLVEGPPYRLLALGLFLRTGAYPCLSFAFMFLFVLFKTRKQLNQIGTTAKLL